MKLKWSYDSNSNLSESVWKYKMDIKCNCLKKFLFNFDILFGDQFYLCSVGLGLEEYCFFVPTLWARMVLCPGKSGVSYYITDYLRQLTGKVRGKLHHGGMWIAEQSCIDFTMSSNNIHVQKALTTDEEITYSTSWVTLFTYTHMLSASCWKSQFRH